MKNPVLLINSPYTTSTKDENVANVVIKKLLSDDKGSIEIKNFLKEQIGNMPGSSQNALVVERFGQYYKVKSDKEQSIIDILHESDVHGAHIDHAISCMDPVAVFAITPDFFLTADGYNKLLRDKIYNKYNDPVFTKELDHQTDWHTHLPKQTVLHIWDTKNNSTKPDIPPVLQAYNELDVAEVESHIRSKTEEQLANEKQDFFTTDTIMKNLDEIDDSYFSDPYQAFVDPCCGDGNLLGEVLIRKLQHSIDFTTALSQLYGCETQPSYVETTKQRLLCGRDDLRHIVDKNILCVDALKYDMSWGAVSDKQKEKTEHSIS